jgi:catechol 2,3-dioxygenase-like lactoylglutathione lyase family enzyme
MDLNQVTIHAVDVDACVEFYRKLGLRLIVDTRPRYVRFECPEGGSTFSIHQVDEMAPTGAAIIYFECDDLDGRVASLKESGIEFDSDPEDMRWRWREARLRDPAGHEICLFRAGDNRRHPPWRVTD